MGSDTVHNVCVNKFCKISTIFCSSVEASCKKGEKEEKKGP